MKRYVTLLLFLFLFFISSLSRADLDVQGIKDALGYTQDYAASFFSLLFSLLASLFAFTLIIKIIKRAGDAEKARLAKSINAAAFTEHKKFTATPNTRYGSSYNRQ